MFHLIFPWAEVDLYGLWQLDQTSPAPSERRNSVQTLSWLAQQCQGLAEGLICIHSHKTSLGESLLHPDSIPLHGKTPNAEGHAHQNSRQPIYLFGRHSDLKPDNILWFPGPDHKVDNFQGILKIADFGFVEFSRKEMVDKGRRGFVVRSPTYLPPEVELENDVSSLYDIWSLGCIYLEFVAWWLGGWSHVRQFSQSRLQPGSTLPGWAAVPSRLPFALDPFFQVSKNKETDSLKANIKDSVRQVCRPHSQPCACLKQALVHHRR